MNFMKLYFVGLFAFFALSILCSSLWVMADYISFLSKSPIRTTALVTAYFPPDEDGGAVMWVRFIDSAGRNITASLSGIPSSYRGERYVSVLYDPKYLLDVRGGELHPNVIFGTVIGAFLTFILVRYLRHETKEYFS